LQYTGKSLQHPFNIDYNGIEYICTVNFPIYNFHVLMRKIGKNTHRNEKILIYKNVNNITDHSLQYVGLPPLSHGFNSIDFGINLRKFGLTELSYEGIKLCYS
jgi:hypothetical protein